MLLPKPLLCCAPSYGLNCHNVPQPLSRLVSPSKKNQHFCTVFCSQRVSFLATTCLFRSKSCESFPLSTNREGKGFGGMSLGEKKLCYRSSSRTELMVHLQGSWGCVSSLCCKLRAAIPQVQLHSSSGKRGNLHHMPLSTRGPEPSPLAV